MVYSAIDAFNHIDRVFLVYFSTLLFYFILFCLFIYWLTDFAGTGDVHLGSFRFISLYIVTVLQ
jgi:hypothetical protein